MTKESIEKIIRNNRPGIAAAQIMGEIENMRRELNRMNMNGRKNIPNKGNSLAHQIQMVENNSDRPDFR